MKSDEKNQAFDANEFPALQDFLSAYLHEDFGEEYVSAAEAVNAFFAEASGDQVEDVREEWLRLRESLMGHSFGEIQNAIRRLGAAWQPSNEEEWRSVDEILSRPRA
jgi:hypothetical protein